MEPDDDKTQTHIALAQDTMVGHYRIIEKIGAGGMGEVYLAQDAELDRNVALKFLPHHLCQDDECRRRFKREAQAAARLDHPNIVPVHEVGEHQGRPYFAMAHIEGPSLDAVIKKDTIGTDQAINLALQICEGLQEAHDAGVIHRDIKPGNIIIDHNGRPRLLDFGLASVKGEEKITRTGSTMGTVAYMSPEQVKGQEIDQRSDLFSLGVVLFELIAGRTPFHRDTEAATLQAIAQEIPEPVTRYKAAVSDGIQEIIHRALDKNIETRYQTAAGMAAELRREKQALESGESHFKRGKTRSRMARILVPALVLITGTVLLILKPWKIEVQPTQEVAAAQNRLLVMDFDNLADPRDSLRWGEIAANLLMTDLMESQYIQIVSSQRFYDILSQLGHANEKKVSANIASQIAARAQAKWMLQGSILKTDPEIVLTSQLVDVASGDIAATQSIEGVAGEDIFQIVDRLTVELKNDLALPAAALQEPDRPVADITTDSPDAYRHYILGEEFTLKFYFPEAEAQFREALKYDSTFAAAYMRLLYFAPDDELEWLRSKMLQYAHKASRKEQMNISTMDAGFKGNWNELFHGFSEMVRLYPDDKEALWKFAVLERDLFRQRKQSIFYLEELVALDLNFGQAYNYLAFNFAELGDYRRAFRAADKYIEVAPDAANSYDTRGCLYMMTGQLDEAITSFRQALNVKPDFDQTLASMGLIHLFRQEYQQAEEYFQKLASHPDRDERTNGRLYLARIPLYRGKFQEAIKKLNVVKQAREMESGNLGTLLDVLYTSAIAEVIFRSNPAAGLAGIREAYNQLDSAVVPLPFHQMRFKGLEAFSYATMGNYKSADSVLRESAGMFDSSWVALTEIYNFWHGLVDYERGNFTRSIQFLEQAETTKQGFPEKFFLARSYLAANQVGNAVEMFEKALKYYHNRRFAWLGLSAPVHYFAGLAYEKSQWNDKAAEQYRVFLDIWSDADSGIVEVQDARERLARLTSAP